MHMAPHQGFQRHDPNMLGSVQKSRPPTTMILEAFLSGDRMMIEN